jgi:hypothetical protein
MTDETRTIAVKALRTYATVADTIADHAHHHGNADAHAAHCIAANEMRKAASEIERAGKVKEAGR